MNTNTTLEQAEQDFKAAELAFDAARAAYRASGYAAGYTPDAPFQIFVKAEENLAWCQRKLNDAKKAAMPAEVNYGRCGDCGKKLTKRDVDTSDRKGYCYNCA